ncbi:MULTISPECIES: methyl-accepting chemotaxis protein [Bacillus]|uniref:methyl-accepting chemotaxis protein n=1 Tax=Bacillus TaxID=1386 RepID=UPI0002E9F5AF|nr:MULTISPECIES: methyl-accepting chemotaxis protein [Bacillus]
MESKLLQIEAERETVKAFLSFTLAHTELICFESQLKNEMATRLTSISDETFASSEEITAAINHISNTMDQLSLSNDDNLNKLSDLNNLKNDFQMSISSVLENSTQLHNRISQIDSITNDIADIAAQTNLLSLNASIEAARAGESGKGFAVVADEVRKLSSQTKDSVVKVSEVARNVEKSSNNTDHSLTSLQNNVTKFINQTAVLNKALEENIDQIQLSNSAIHELNAAIENQNEASASIMEITHELHESSEFSEKLRLHMKDLYQTMESHIQIDEKQNDKIILAARLNDHADFLRNIVQNAEQIKKSVITYRLSIWKMV